MTKTSFFKTGVIDIGLEFGQLDPPNVFSNEFFRVCTPLLKTNNQFSFIKLLKQLDIAEEFEVMKLLLLEMKGYKDGKDERIFNYLKNNIEFTNIINDTFILPIKSLEEYLEYMMELRETIIKEFDFIEITYTLEDDNLNTYDVYLLEYFIGTLKDIGDNPELKERQIKLNIESKLINGTMLEDIRNSYKSYL